MWGCNSSICVIGAGKEIVMGAWGYGPFDSDSAGEFVSEIVDQLMKPVEKIAKKRGLHSYSYRYEEAVAAIEIVMYISKSSSMVFEHQLEECVGALDMIMADGEYIRMWDNSNKMHKQLSDQRKALKSEISRLNARRYRGK